MILIGLTGNIATGKSMVGRLLTQLGAHLIDADALVRDLQRTGTPAYDAMVAEFGAGILRADGEIDRPTLSTLAFSDPSVMRRLEAILHPAVGREIKLLISNINAQNENAVIVIEAIKLIEAGLRTQCNALWVVTAKPQVQLERLMHIRGLSEPEARLRIEAQLPQSEKAALADVVIENDGTLDKLRSQVQHHWEAIG